MKIRFLILLLFIGLLGYYGCTDDPTSLGKNILPGEDFLNPIEIDSYTGQFTQRSKTYDDNIDSLGYGGASSVLFGNYKNLKMEMMIAFLIIPDDTTAQAVSDGTVLISDSWITMVPKYWIGDKTNLNFSVKKINDRWNSFVFTKDSLARIKSSLGENLLLQNTYSFSDSLIKFSINEQIVKNWVVRNVDSTVEKNYGIFFEPDPSSQNIVGFQAVATVVTSDFIRLDVVFEKPGIYKDTLSFTPYLDIHSVTAEKPDEVQGEMVLQSGSAQRGVIWFDLSSIPPNATVNKAAMDLFINPANTYIGSVPADTIAVSFLTDSTKYLVNRLYGRDALLRKDNKYQGDIRDFIQRWVDGAENQGLRINLTDETRGASTVSIYNSYNQVDSLRPRLTIYYTTKK